MPADPAVLQRVVVLAGGTSRRFGRDKLLADLDGTTVIDHLLNGLEQLLPGIPVVVVGSRRPVRAAVTWASENPPGGGPVAGLAAGLASLPGSSGRAAPAVADADLVAVVAGDQPFGAAAVGQLVSALLLAAARGRDAGRSFDAAWGVDAEGRDQPLLAVYRAGPLRRAIGDRPAGRRVRDVTAGLRVLPVDLAAGASLDVDTEADLDAARAELALRREGRSPHGH